MGYGVYFDGHRWAGYMVPAECDMPECKNKIYRGLDYKCETVWDTFYDDETETETEVEEEGCGLFFCPEHQYQDHDDAVEKDEHPEWMWWQLYHYSWAEWRAENPKKVEEYVVALDGFTPPEGLAEELREENASPR